MVKYNKNRWLYGWWLYLLVILFAQGNIKAAIYRTSKQLERSCRHLPNNLNRIQYLGKTSPTYQAPFFMNGHYGRFTRHHRDQSRTQQIFFRKKPPYIRSSSLGVLMALGIATAIWLNRTVYIPEERQPLTEEITTELKNVSQFTTSSAQDAYVERLCRRYPKKAEKIRQVWEEPTMISKELLHHAHPNKFRGFTRRNFRKNLRIYQGLSAPPVGKEAHHIFPVALEDNFKKAEFAIHHPEYGVWVEKHTHRCDAAEYNKKWKFFFEDYKERGEIPTHAAIFDEARKILAEYELTRPLPIWI